MHSRPRAQRLSAECVSASCVVLISGRYSVAEDETWVSEDTTWGACVSPGMRANPSTWGARQALADGIVGTIKSELEKKETKSSFLKLGVRRFSPTHMRRGGSGHTQRGRGMRMPNALVISVRHEACLVRRLLLSPQYLSLHHNASVGAPQGSHINTKKHGSTHHVAHDMVWRMTWCGT